MPTYTLISSVTVGSGGAANIEFTSIPQTYTDLLLKVSLRTSTSNSFDMIKITFNNSSSGYSYRSIYANGSGAFSYSGSGSFFEYQDANGTSSTANTFSNGELYIPNYAGSNNKSASLDTVTEDNSSTAFIVPMALLWANTSAITSIKLITNSGLNFAQYATTYLYGISNA